MARSPSRFSAKPTLRGLVALSKEADGKITEGALYPWAEVRIVKSEDSTATWQVYDENGERFERDGRSVQLVTSGLAQQIARKAQIRAFKQAWQRGELSHDQEYRDQRTAPRIIFLILIIIFFVVAWHMVPAIPRMWQDTFSSPENLLLLRLVLVLFVFCTLSLFVPMALFCYLLATKPNIRAVRFDQRGLYAKLRDDHEINVDWTHLENMKSFGKLVRLRFRYTPTLWWLVEDSRTRVILSILQEMYFPNVVKKNARRLRNGLIRAGIYWIGGAYFLYAILHRIRPDAEMPIFIFVMFALVAPMYAALFFTAHIERVWRNYKRRKTRAQRQAAQAK